MRCRILSESASILKLVEIQNSDGTVSQVAGATRTRVYRRNACRWDGDLSEDIGLRAERSLSGICRLIEYATRAGIFA